MTNREALAAALEKGKPSPAHGDWDPNSILGIVFAAARERLAQLPKESGDMNAQHVVPTDDLIKHETSEDCVCIPRPIFVDGGVVLLHNSLDGREQDEEGPDV